ncbi:MAG: transposase [Acidimicrobiia bacterium]|nr:transposase [Acidimicrobiia bacterium]
MKDSGGASRWRSLFPTGPCSYEAAISQYLPDARHVLDRFHVAGWFTQSLTLVRREIHVGRPLSRRSNQYLQLMGRAFSLGNDRLWERSYDCQQTEETD